MNNAWAYGGKFSFNKCQLNFKHVYFNVPPYPDLAN